MFGSIRNLELASDTKTGASPRKQPSSSPAGVRIHSALLPCSKETNSKVDSEKGVEQRRAENQDIEKA